jgi:hypothetical protein
MISFAEPETEGKLPFMHATQLAADCCCQIWSELSMSAFDMSKVASTM